MSVYIAGGSSERLTVVRPLIDAAIDAGVHVTYDWTRDPGWDIQNISRAQLRQAARRDFAGVELAEIVWLVVPTEKSEGSAVELGYALGWRQCHREHGYDHGTIIVSGTVGARNIFAMLADEFFETHEQALAWVVERHGGNR